MHILRAASHMPDSELLTCHTPPDLGKSPSQSRSRDSPGFSDVSTEAPRGAQHRGPGGVVRQHVAAQLLVSTSTGENSGTETRGDALDALDITSSLGKRQQYWTLADSQAFGRSA